MTIRSEVFDDVDGKFEARLRGQRVVSRSFRAREGEVTLSSPVAVLEVKFDFIVLDRLHDPCFVAIERRTANLQTYMIYEVASLMPIHYQMLGMDVAMPTVIRKEYLDTIEKSWGASEETWIDVTAVPTGYRMDLDGDAHFIKSKLTPLTGARCSLLSKKAVQKLICVQGGAEIGELIGFEIPLTVQLDSLVRYHLGIFGFTGSGKSNLTSFIIRQALSKIPDLKVVVFDVAGEYAIHLLDLLAEEAGFHTTEKFWNDPDRFLDSQAIPETLEIRVSRRLLQEKVRELFAANRIRRLSLSQLELPKMNLAAVIGMLISAVEKGASGATIAKIGLERITEMMREGGIDEATELRDLDSNSRHSLLDILKGLMQRLTEKAGLKGEIDAMIEYISTPRTKESGRGADATTSFLSPEELAHAAVSHDPERLKIVYIPEPYLARLAVSRFLDRLLLLKKTTGVRERVLIVLDEAQEFIPDRTRAEDFTERSNRSVEALLRQGRKYRAFCWLATQRVAHLNVSALQQLHSYFVSTLPRFYDRMVIADAFSLSYEILERTTELETGEWLFVSYKATNQKNVPVFIHTPNNEDILLRLLRSVGA